MSRVAEGLSSRLDSKGAMGGFFQVWVKAMFE